MPPLRSGYTPRRETFEPYLWRVTNGRLGASIYKGPIVFSGGIVSPSKAMRSFRSRSTLWAALVVALAATAAAQDVSPPSLDHGYRLMYNLDFAGAQHEFEEWQRVHQADPVGPASEAAGLLFSELHRLHVLEAKFFTNDEEFRKRPKLEPDPQVKVRFEAKLMAAQILARSALAHEPKDQNALFTMALVSGLRADYLALIENRDLASLDYTKEGSRWGQELLAVAPDFYDAYLATGIGKYLVGIQPAPVRWFLRLGGHAGDKSAGVRELTLCAEHGRYLAPFARLLLAIAYLRDHDPGRARVLLASLHDDFPANPLFARELARLEAAP